MIEFGKINKLEVIKQKEYGYFVGVKDVSEKIEILLPTSNIVDPESIVIGEDVEVFVYKDSLGRLVATQKKIGRASCRERV